MRAFINKASCINTNTVVALVNKATQAHDINRARTLDKELWSLGDQHMPVFLGRNVAPSPLLSGSHSSALASCGLGLGFLVMVQSLADSNPSKCRIWESLVKHLWV